jgi:hypothetical protein
MAPLIDGRNDGRNYFSRFALPRADDDAGMARGCSSSIAASAIQETQAILPRLKSDLVELIEATIDGTLSSVEPEWDTRAAVTVVMASGGYPASMKPARRSLGSTVSATCLACRFSTPARDVRTAAS